MGRLHKPLPGVLVALTFGLAFFPFAPLLPRYRQPHKPSDQPQDLSPTETSSEVHLVARETSLPADYVIGPEDVVEIDVFNVPELGRTVRVANNGTISLPLIGRVRAAGFAPAELRKELEAEWGENYLQGPQVTVFVREFRAQPVSIIGAVENPGLYQMTAPRTLIEMLSRAGGLGEAV